MFTATVPAIGRQSADSHDKLSLTGLLPPFLTSCIKISYLVCLCLLGSYWGDVARGEYTAEIFFWLYRQVHGAGTKYQALSLG